MPFIQRRRIEDSHRMERPDYGLDVYMWVACP